ncbi:MAG: GTP 3',8-cyclase MoaA, partial [Gemmataceae bacterium]
FGVIASVTRSFCGQCNRLRLTADGHLRNCLFALEETPLKPALRPAVDEARVRAAYQECVLAKEAGHQIRTAQFLKPTRTMHAIGG